MRTWLYLSPQNLEKLNGPYKFEKILLVLLGWNVAFFWIRQWFIVETFNKIWKQAEAEVVPSLSLVEVEVEVGVKVGVEVGVEVKVEVGVEVGVLR